MSFTKSPVGAEILIEYKIDLFWNSIIVDQHDILLFTSIVSKVYLYQYVYSSNSTNSLRAEFQITKLYVRYIQLYAPYANNIKHIYVVVDFLLHHTSLKILKTISISTSNQKHTSSYILRMKKYWSLSMSPCWWNVLYLRIFSRNNTLPLNKYH